MRRFNIHEARTLHIVWHESKDAFEFRMMYGKRFLTPVLWITPKEWQVLWAWGTIILKDFRGNEWVSLSRNSRTLHIEARQKFDYGKGGNLDRDRWPEADFIAFHTLAQEERGGLLPETGWNRMS